MIYENTKNQSNMKNLKVLFTVLCVACATSAWGETVLTGNIVYSCKPISIANSTSYGSYSGNVTRLNSTDLVSTASWQMTCGSSNGLGSNNNQKAKMILSNGSFTASSAIAKAIGKTTSATYVAALICNTALENVGKFSFSHGGYGNNAPSNMWLCYSTDDWATATAISLTVGTSGECTFESPIATAKYAFVIYKTSYTTVKTPTFTFYEASSGSGETTYSVTFDAGTNGTCSTTSLTETSQGSGVTLPSCIPNAGYTFVGWATSSSATSANVGEAGTLYKPTSNCTLYAVYSAIQYTVTWVVGSNSSKPKSYTTQVAHGSKATPPDDLTLTGSEIGNCVDTFVGWSKSTLKSPTDTPPSDLFKDKSHDAITENTTFYAVFTNFSVWIPADICFTRMTFFR